MEVLNGTLRNLCGNGGFSNQKKFLLSSILDDFLLVQALAVLVVIDVQQAVDCGRNGLWSIAAYPAAQPQLRVQLVLSLAAPG